MNDKKFWRPQTKNKKIRKEQNMKKIVTIILTLAMLLSCGTFVISADSTTPAVWDGTTIDYDWYLNAPEAATDFYIGSAAGLAGLASLVNDGTSFQGMTIYLSDDIYLNANSENYASWGETAPANNWTPIGTNSKPFRGRFDGQGHAIYGMYIGTSNGDNQVGLFGCINGGVSKEEATDATNCGVNNLRVVNSYIGSTAAGSHNKKMGMIVGQLYNGNAYVNAIVISNVYTHGIIKPKYGESNNKPWVGGMIGQIENDSWGTFLFENLVSNVTITSNYSAGGIIGGDNTVKNAHENKKLIFRNLVNLGDITIEATHDVNLVHAGGIFAGCSTKNTSLIETFEISNCVNLGNIKCDYTDRGYVGGIVGYYCKGVKLDKALNAGSVSGFMSDAIIGGTDVADVAAPVVTNAYTTTEAAGKYATKVADASVKGANALAALAGFDWVATADYPLPTAMTAYLAGKLTLANVRLAATQETAAANGKIKVRLIGAVDSLEYSSVGFAGMVGMTPMESTTKTVSTSVAYAGGKAAAFDNYITPYVYAIELGEISATGTVVINVVATAKGLDGTDVSSAQYKITYTDGVFVSAVVSQ